MATLRQTSARTQLRPRGRMASLWLMLVATAFAGLALGAPPVAVMTLLGMLPTAVAFFVRWRDDDTAAYAVAGMNLAGLLPVVLPLFRTLHSDLTRDILSLVGVYAAAAFGWMLVVVAASVSEAIGCTLALREQQTIEARQRRLIEEWGPEVRSNRAPARRPGGNSAVQ